MRLKVVCYLCQSSKTAFNNVLSLFSLPISAEVLIPFPAVVGLPSCPGFVNEKVLLEPTSLDGGLYLFSAYSRHPFGKAYLDHNFYFYM